MRLKTVQGASFLVSLLLAIVFGLLVVFSPDKLTPLWKVLMLLPCAASLVLLPWQFLDELLVPLILKDAGWELNKTSEKIKGNRVWEAKRGERLIKGRLSDLYNQANSQ